MAKWGEGDPRWIVEERPDATNVNNWHWKESDATSWSKDKLNELFLQFTIVDDEKNLSVKIIEFETLTGEATANNRKGKLIYFYEWDLVMKWEGRILNDEEATKIKGKITVPNLSEENSLKELEINIITDEYNDKSDILKKFMMEVGRPKIREQLGKYMDGLRCDYAKNLILPRKDEVQAQTTTKASTVSTNKNVVNKTTDKSAESKPLGVKIDCKTIILEEKFQCKAKELFDCFAKVELVQAFTRDSAKVDFTKNGEFALFGGNITGKFDEIVPNEKITKQWRVKSWPTGHYSIAEFTFEEKEDHTMLKLKQTFVPTNEYENTEKNWSRYYFTPIKQTFNFGSFLL